MYDTLWKTSVATIFNSSLHVCVAYVVKQPPKKVGANPTTGVP